MVTPDTLTQILCSFDTVDWFLDSIYVDDPAMQFALFCYADDVVLPTDEVAPVNFPTHEKV